MGPALRERAGDARWAEALRWLTAANDQGNAMAQHPLHELYEHSPPVSTLADATERLKSERRQYLDAV